MIENIRKYKGIIVLGIAAVIFALVIGIKDDLFRRGDGSHAILKIDGRTYSDVEFGRLGSGSYDLGYGLAGSGDFALYQFLMAVSTGSADDRERFFTGRILLREAMEEAGVSPGEEEVSERIRQLRAFAAEGGGFSEEKYRNFVDRVIGRFGMTESDLREFVKDAIGYEKVNELIGAGLVEQRDVLAINQALGNQQVSGELARLDIGPFKEKVQPTDDEVKTYWENIQDLFKTQLLRKFSYVIVTPQMPAEPQAGEPEEKESLADAAATDEQKKAKEAEKAAAKAKKDAELADARRKKQVETDALVDDFTFKLEEQKGAGFDELAKANGWQVQTTGLFGRDAVPKELDVDLRASSRGGKAADELFRMEVTSDPLSKISRAIAIGENQWLVARLDGEEAVRNKTFDEAKDEAKTQYVQEKAAEALKKAAAEALEKIKAAVAGGKSFADAAKEAGISETRKFEKVGRSHQPDAAAEPANLFMAASFVDPGAVADVITEGERAFILHVARREVVKEAEAAARLDGEVRSSAARNGMAAFGDWMQARYEAAKVEQLYKQK